MGKKTPDRDYIASIYICTSSSYNYYPSAISHDVTWCYCCCCCCSVNKAKWRRLCKGEQSRSLLAIAPFIYMDEACCFFSCTLHYTTLHYTMVHDVVSSSHQIRLTSFSFSSYSLSLTRDCCCCDVRTAAVCCSMEQGERIYLSSLSSLSSLCSLSDAALLWEWSCQLLLLLFVHTCPLPPSAMIIVVVFLWRVNPFRPIDSDRLIALSLHPSAVVITPRARCTTVRCCCSCCW